MTDRKDYYFYFTGNMETTYSNVDLKRSGSDPQMVRSQPKHAGSSSNLEDARLQHIESSILNFNDTGAGVYKDTKLPKDIQKRCLKLHDTQYSLEEMKELKYKASNPDQLLFKKLLENDLFRPVTSDLGPANLRSSENRRHDKRKEDNLRYADAMTLRHLRPRSNELHYTKQAVGIVPFVPDSVYIERMPIWPVHKPEKIQEYDYYHLLMAMDKITCHGIYTCSQAKNITMRRHMLQDILDGKIYNFFKNRYYFFNPREARSVRRWLRIVFPDFVNWMVVQPIEPHGLFDPYGLFETTALVGTTYLINKYMDYARERAIANAPFIFISKGIKAIKDTFISAVRAVADAFSSAVSSVVGGDSSAWNKVWLIHGVVTVAYCIYRYASKSPKMKSVMDSIVAANGEVSVNDDVIQPHGDYGPLVVAASLAGIVLPVFGLNILKSYRSISTIYKDVGGPTDIFTFMKEGVNMTCEMCGFDPLFTIIDHLKIYRDIIERADSILNRDTLSQDVIRDPQIYALTCSVLEDCNTHYRTIVSDRTMMADISKDFLRIKPALIKLRNKISATNRMFEGRMEPPVIWLSGPPGQGKTVLGQGLRSALFQMLFKKSISPSDVWTKNKATPYDDGYAQQWATHIPEIFQSTLPQCNVLEALGLIQMADSSVLPLNMSAVDDKGTVNYCSKIIFADTNGNMENTGIYDLGAIKRRQTFPLTVIRKKNINLKGKVTIKDLDEAWTLRVHKDAAKDVDRKIYQGMCSDLKIGVDYTVTEIVRLMYFEYIEREQKTPVADVFSSLDWDKAVLAVDPEEKSEEFFSLSDSEPEIFEKHSYCAMCGTDAREKGEEFCERCGHAHSSSSGSSQEVIQPHGALDYLNFLVPSGNMKKGNKPLPDPPAKAKKLTDDAINKINIPRAAFAKELLEDDEIVNVVYAVVPARDSLIGTATHGILLVKGKYVCDFTSKVNFSVRGTAKYDKTVHNAVNVNHYKVKTSTLIRVMTQYTGTQWDLITHNCQDFLFDIISPENPQFNTVPLEDLHSLVSWFERPTGIIKDNSRTWYFVPWLDRAFTGDYLTRKYPTSTDGETHFPEFTSEYLMLTDQDSKESFYDLFLGDVPSYGKLECDDGMPVTFKHSGQKISKNFAQSHIDTHNRLGGPSRFVKIGGDYAYISFETVVPYRERISKTVSEVASKAYNYMPISVRTQLDKFVSEPAWTLSKKAIVLGVSLGSIFLFYKAMTTLVVPAMGSVYNTILDLFGAREEVIHAESLNRHINFQPGQPIHAHGKSQQMDSVVSKYSCRIKKVRVLYKESSLECLIYFLSSKVAAITNHSVAGQVEEIEIFDDGMDHGTRYRHSEFKIHSKPGREVTYITFDRDIASVKSIIKHLRKRSDAKESYGNIVRLKRTEKGSCSISQRLPAGKSITPRGLWYYTAKQGKHIRNVNEYYCTENTGLSYGDCSLPYLESVGTDLKLIGIHFGGINDMAFIAPIYEEDVPVIECIDFISPISENMIKDTINSHSVIPGLNYVATLKTPLRQVTKNKIDLSPLAKTDMELTGIPDLKMQKADLYGPVVKHAFRYYLGYAPVAYPRILENMEFQDPLIFERGFIPPSPKTVGFVKIEEAILGNDSGIDSLDQTTSTGPTLSMGLIEGLPKSSRRSTYFDKQTQWIHPEFLKMLYDVKEKAERGVATLPVVGDSFKVEMRSTEKLMVIDGVEYIKPRVFGCTDLAVLIEHKAVFGNMCHEMHRKFSESCDLVGINPISYAWKRLSIKLRQFPNLFGMDVKGCDNSHNRRIVLRFFRWCNGNFFHFKKGTRSYNRLLCACLTINSVFHIYMDNLYMTEGKNPSGCFLTCLINVFFIFTRLTQIFYFVQYEKFGNIDMKFEDHVCFNGFGDDNITSVSDEVAPWFNRNVIFKHMKEIFGIICTAPDKSLIVKDFDTWEEADLLKRKFKFEDPYVWAPIEESSILKSLLFTDKKFPDKESAIAHYEQVLSAANHEYAMHGEERYQWFVSQFKPRFEKIGGVWNFGDYNRNIGRLKSTYFGCDFAYSCL